MRKFHQFTHLLAVGVLLTGLSAGLFAQDQQDKDQRDRMANATTLTGCLNKDASGAFMLTDETTGVKTTVTGAADLEKYSGNHKVTLTGAAKNDASGKPIFEVAKLKHVADTCKVPGQQ
jgi:hypothetical protein